MHKARLEAFSDGVMAILITIMVLELRTPQGIQWSTLRSVLPTLFSYVLSFIYLGIYWNNHHHMFHTVDRVNGTVLWANLHLLFWLSFLPFVTSWSGQNHFAPVPTAMYGVVLLLCGFAYLILQTCIIRFQGHESRLAAAVGNDRKGRASLAFYALGIPLALVDHPWISEGLYVLVALIWLVPDRRIERRV